MVGHARLSLLSGILGLCLLKTDATTSYAAVTLPDWKSNGDYNTKCDFNHDLSPFCDWNAEGLIRSEGHHGQFHLSKVSESPHAQLQREFVDLSEDSCLEFWYYKPGQDSSEMRVLIQDAVQTQIWSSLNVKDNSWRQVYIPLRFTQQSSTQITFELWQKKKGEKEIGFGRIGVRRGQCENQCRSGTQFCTDSSTTCLCMDGQLACLPSVCETRRSVPAVSGTCRVTSDLQYTTFDGVKSRFVGHCTHVLTKVCTEAGALAEFEVAVQNEQGGGSSDFPISRVNVYLQGLTVILLRKNMRGALVNGIWKNLPLTVDGEKITISADGRTVVLRTDFNLSLYYARSGALQVTVPEQFSNRLCGMCGRFMMDDKTQTPGISLARYDRDLGQTGNGSKFHCVESTMTGTCSEMEQQKFTSEMYCGVVLSHDGPFSGCSAVDTSAFYKSCVFDMCTTKGDRDTFCDFLEDFARACGGAGNSVANWRDLTKCPLACGANSHFNACSSDCSATCSSLDAPEDCGSCKERCECDEGFLLSGDECVPAAECGCWVDGQHYERGQTFMEADCERSCTCQGKDKLICSASSCPAHEVCKVQHGVLGCFPSSPMTCSVYGDPHYITFDGKAYSFQGTCNYTIAKTCGAGKALFALTARNEGWRNSTYLNSVALHVDGFHLVMKKSRLAYVNGHAVKLPYSYGRQVNVSLAGPYLQVSTDFGLRLLFNGNDRLFVQVDERHGGGVCGLCGTYSGSQFDDFLTPDGVLVPSAYEFASSWNTHDPDWRCNDGSPDLPPCSPELDSDGFLKCSKLFGDAFKACHWFVPPQIFVNSCVQDYCTSEGDQVQFCTSLDNYVAACEVAEVDLGEWWKGTVCDHIPTKEPTTHPDTPTPTVIITPTPTTSCSWTCNFDRDKCGWEQLITDSFNWTRQSGSTPSDNTGPTTDHTTGSGFYLYTEGDGVSRGDSARIMSPVCHTVDTQCLTFWYHMFGWADAMGLNVYQLEDNRASKIWSRTNNQGNDWHLAQIEIYPRGPFQIIVEGIRGSTAQSDVAWDDVNIVHGKCDKVTETPDDEAPLVPSIGPSVIPSVSGIDCNFDTDLCTWTQLLTDVFDWTRHSGSTPTSMTGPLTDHTTGSGHYMYIEGDSASHGDTARLLSKECSDVQPQCLQFWYHMYGSSWTMGLSVYLVHGNAGQEIWRKREDQGNVWYQALVDITPHDKFQILFEGRRGHSARSDVAFDDVSLHKGTCADLIKNSNGSSIPQMSTMLPPVSNPTTAPHPPIQTITPKLTQRTPPPSKTSANVCRMDCTFETSLCTWTQLLTDVFDWTRHQGATPTLMTGPTSDHTTGTGSYLYIEGDDASHGDTARLLSEDCSDVQPQCLQFWYHMYGSSWTMGLSVYLVHGNTGQEIWRKREDQGKTWHQAFVDISPHGKFQVLFEGRRGHSDKSDVALDDVSLHRGTCADLINGPTGSAPQMSTVISTIINTATTTTPEPSTTTHSPTTTPEPTTTTMFECDTVPSTSTTTPEPSTTTQPPSTTTPEPTTTTHPPTTTPEPTTTTLFECDTVPSTSTTHPPSTTTPEPTTTTHPPTTTPEPTTTMHPPTTTPEPTTTTHPPTTTPEPTTTTHPPTTTIEPTTTTMFECDTVPSTSTTHPPSTTTPEPSTTTQPPTTTTPEPSTTTQPPTTTTPEPTTTTMYECDTVPSTSTTQPPSTTTPEPTTTTHPPTTTPEPTTTTMFECDTVPSTSTTQPPSTTTPQHTTVAYFGPDGAPFSTMCRMDCNFDSGLCTWSQLLTDVFDWTRNEGSTPTLMTGPSSDHTTGSGHYLYIEGDSASHGDTARLLSEDCSDVQPQCLRFWYHMYGSSWTMGLSVYLVHGNKGQEIWRKREDQGNTWHQAFVDISPHGKFQIVFEGRRGHSERSDVALDDVFLHRGTCADFITHLIVSPHPKTSRVLSTPTGFPPVCQMDCGFDHDLCTWTQLLTDVFDWTRLRGPTSSWMTGPSSDHTTGSGYFLYIEGESTATGDTARLLSDECSDVQPHCLQFWYHMYGPSWTMGLHVYLVHGGVAQEIWRRREYQGEGWNQAEVDITPHDKFQIIFEGLRGLNTLSEVALDDVTLHRGTCKSLKPIED